MTLTDWTDGDDPYAATAALLDPDGRYAISDSAWAMHVLALQAALPGSSYVSMTSALPMLRAIKDATRSSASPRPAPPPTRPSRRSCRCGSPGGPRTRSPPIWPASAQARPLAGRLHRGRLRPERRQPAPRDVRADDRGGRHGRARLRRAQGRLRLGHHPHRARRRADRRGARGLRDRPPAQQAGFEAVARRRLPGDRPRRAQGDLDAGYGEYFIHRVGHGIGLRPTSRRTWSRARRS